MVTTDSLVICLFQIILVMTFNLSVKKDVKVGNGKIEKIIEYGSSLLILSDSHTIVVSILQSSDYLVLQQSRWENVLFVDF